MSVSNSTHFEFSRIGDEDIQPLTEIMTRAFDEDARIHLGEGRTDGPEGYNTGEFLRRWALNSSCEAFKIRLHGELIGAYMVYFYINKCRFQLIKILQPGDLVNESYVLQKEMNRSKSQ